MELFIWEKSAVCAEYQRLFPKESSRVIVRTPLFSPRVTMDTVCLCQKENCPIVKIGACSHRATFIEVYPPDNKITGRITPELNSVYRPKPSLANLSTA